MSWTNAGPQATAGPEIQDIYQDSVGFLNVTIGKEKKVSLSLPWPADKQPPAWASLLSIASRKGLLAAATSGSVIVASTESVRKTYQSTSDQADPDQPLAITPQLTLAVPQVSHVAFSSDESSLVIAAQDGGGLAVYHVQALLQGKQDMAFQLSTNGISIRALAPNPSPDMAHLFAIILTDGKLMIADLKQNQLINAPNGPVFREGVRCVSWSVKGKQLVAGLEDGSAEQYDPQGNVKAQIPRPAQLDQGTPMSSIVWIANDDFLLIHTPHSEGEASDSSYHIMHRDKASGTFTSQMLAGDPCMPGMDTKRFPAQFLISRLRKFAPDLEDALILCSSAGSEVGLITNSSSPLEKSKPVINTYTVTNMELDTSRATLPMSVVDGMSDTAPVGMDLDLSATEQVMQPIPSDDTIEQSAGPLPAVMVLNNEGILSAWWFIHNASIRQGTSYAGLTSTQPSTTQPAASTPVQSAPASTGFAAFGKSSFGQPAFGKAATPAFGQASTPASGPGSQSVFGKPAFGQSATPAFGKAAFGSPSVPGIGSASALGAKASPWGQSATQTPIPVAPSGQVFGSALASSSGNLSFGSPSQSGSKAPIWAASSSTTQKSAFGQASGLGGFAGFSSAAKDENTTLASPFAAAANKDQTKSSSASPFAAFSQPSSGNSAFASAKTDDSKASSMSFGFGKPSVSPAAASSQPAEDSKEENMNDEAENKPQEENVQAKPSPFALPAKVSPSVFGQLPAKSQSTLFGEAPDKSKTSSLFGKPTEKAKSPSIFAQTTKQTGFQFGKPSEAAASPRRESTSDKPSKLPTLGGFKLNSGFQGDGSAKDDLPRPKQGGSLFGAGFSNMLGEVSKETTSAKPIKKEPGTESPTLEGLSSAETDESSVEAEEAPLPPDFMSAKPKQQTDNDMPPIAGSPPVDLGDEALKLPASEDEEDDDGSWVQDSGEESEGNEEEQDGSEEGEEYDEDDDEDDEEGSEEEEQDDTINASNAASTTPFGSRLSFPALSHSTGDAGNPRRHKSPVTSKIVPSTTPAGLPKGPYFAPPSKKQETPRSPSPVRPSSVAPASRQSSQPITVPSRKGQSRNDSRPTSAQLSEPPQQEVDAVELSDEEDVRVREILASEIEPSMDLEPFIAHQDYVGRVHSLGIAGQIEKVYRDINSMIDTLGLNARTLEAFVKGHETQYKSSGRDRGDLEEDEEWCLVEVNDLGVVQKEIADDLEAGKVDSVSQKLEELMELQKEGTKLRTRTAEMRKQIGARADPRQRAAHRVSPLSNESQMLQNELREGVASVQKLLQDAEEALIVLRADLAAVPSQGNAAQRVPTVEAVSRTIMKMTAMIEQKSGDVDVLEAQIRRLPGGIANLSLGDSSEDFRSSVRSVRPLERSTSGNMFGTPPKTRGKNTTSNGGAPLGISGMLGRFGGSIRRDHGDVEFGRGSLMLEGTPRKKMADVSVEEVRRYQDRAAQRKRVLAALKSTVEKKGTRVTGIVRK